MTSNEYQDEIEATTDAAAATIDAMEASGLHLAIARYTYKSYCALIGEGFAHDAALQIVCSLQIGKVS